MIKELIEKIASAEYEAEQIINSSFDEAKRINADADSQAEKIKKEIKEKVLEYKLNATKNANDDANIAYDKIVADGKAAGEDLKASTDIDTAENFVIKAFLSDLGVN